MTHPSLIEFWKIKRGMMRQTCQVMPFHHLIADALTNLVMGNLPKDNLMILMPPRCCKTDLGIKAFVPWAMSYFPDSEFILTSWGAELAVDNSVDCRNTLGSDWYRSIKSSKWGADVKMSGDKAGGRQDHFFTTMGGSVKAVGRDGGITGFGAGKLREAFGGAIIMDDLLKANEFDSAAARKSAVNYISGTLQSRRNRMESPSTPQILIMQRLHPEDPAGYLLREEKQDWYVLQIPAHDGKEVIWPGRLNYDLLMKMKDRDPETYHAQYMQSPDQSRNVIFKKEWWRYWHDRAKVESLVTLKFITADTAFKAKDDNDWSVFQCWGAIGTSGLVLLDQIRGRWEFPDLLQQAAAFWKKHNMYQRGFVQSTKMWIEDKASGISLIQTMRVPPCSIPVDAWAPDPDRVSPDKVGRAKQATPSIQSGRILLPDPNMPGYEWVDGFINEHSSFTNDDSHLFDDQVDTETEAVLIWHECGGGAGPMGMLEGL